MGATENAGFNAKVQQKLGLDFVAHTHTPQRPFVRDYPGEPVPEGTETVEQETVSGTICKSVPCSRQITMPAPHPTNQFFTGRMPFVPPNQQRQSTEGYKRAEITAKTSTGLQLSVSDMLAHVNFTAFSMADHRCG